MAQDRKVFVGGVPQDLNQDDLYAIFSEYAGVKKAWLQKCRAADDGNGATNAPQNHRGFGFVIFHDPNAIEELLGGSASRFIVLRNGAKLEVKRALSSSKMSGGNSRAEPPSQESPPLAWPAASGRGQAVSQQQLRTNAEPPIRQRQAGAALAPSQSRAWGSQDGNVLSQLSLMPNSAPAYPNADLRGKAAVGSGQGLMPPGGPQPLGSERSGALTASDGTPLSTYAMLSQQPLLPQHGLLCPPGPGGAPMPSMGEHRVGSRQNAFARSSLRDAIVQFYKEHRPEKLQEDNFVDSISSYYKDKEAELDKALRQKYGVGLSIPASHGQRQLVQGNNLVGASARINHSPAGAAAGAPAVGGTGGGTIAAGYAPVVAGRAQTNTEPMYAGQLGLEPTWLHPGLQASQLPRQPLSQASPSPAVAGAPPQLQWQQMMGGNDPVPGTSASNIVMNSGGEHMPNNVNSGVLINSGDHMAGNVNSTIASGLGSPALFQGAVGDLSAFVQSANASSNSTIGSRTAPSCGNMGGSGTSLGASSTRGTLDASTTTGSSDVGTFLSTNGRGNGDFPLDVDCQHDTGQVQGDEGFEISVEVAEAIVGKSALAIC